MVTSDFEGSSKLTVLIQNVRVHLDWDGMGVGQKNLLEGN